MAAFYSEKVMDHFSNPRNVGELEDANGIGEVGNAKCGDIMKMYIKVENGRIADVKFKTFGCGSAIATSSIATEMIKGKTIEEALQLSNKAVVEALDGLPAHKIHCSVLAEQSIKMAIADYYRRQGVDPEPIVGPFPIRRSSRPVIYKRGLPFFSCRDGFSVPAFLEAIARPAPLRYNKPQEKDPLENPTEGRCPHAQNRNQQLLPCRTPGKRRNGSPRGHAVGQGERRRASGLVPIGYTLLETKRFAVRWRKPRRRSPCRFPTTPFRPTS